LRLGQRGGLGFGILRHARAQLVQAFFGLTCHRHQRRALTGDETAKLLGAPVAEDVGMILFERRDHRRDLGVDHAREFLGKGGVAAAAAPPAGPPVALDIQRDGLAQRHRRRRVRHRWRLQPEGTSGQLECAHEQAFKRVAVRS
jgi:hypothetical protein